MPRNQSTQPLGGSIQISPLASPTAQFARRGKGASAAGSPGQRVLQDFSGLSQVAQRVLNTQKEEKNSQLADIGTQIGKLRETGLSDEEIFEKINADKETPRRTASRLAKLYNKKDGFSRADNPVFKLALQSVRGESRAKAVGREADSMTNEAIQRVADGKPEDREKLIARELFNLRASTADLVDPEELGYFGIRAAEQGLTKVADKFASDLSAGAAAVQLAEAQLEVRTQFIAEVDTVIETYRKGGNVFTAIETFANNVGLVGENAKFAGIVDDTELQAYARAAGGEVALGVGHKEGAEFLEYLADNLKNGNGVAYLAGDAAIQRDIDTYRFKAEKNSTNEYFEAQRKREGTRFGLLEGPIGIELSRLVTEGSPGELLEAIQNAKKLAYGSDPAVFEKQLGIPFDPNTRGTVLDWLDDQGIQLSRKQSAFDQIAFEIVEGDYINKFIEDEEETLRALDLNAAGLSGLQLVGLRAKLSSIRDSGTSDGYRAVKASGLEQVVAESILQTVQRDTSTGEPLDPHGFRDKVNGQMARIRTEIVFDKVLADRLASSSVEVDDYLFKKSKTIIGDKALRKQADGSLATDAERVGKQPGDTDLDVKTRIQRSENQMTTRNDYARGVLSIGGLDLEDRSSGIEKLQNIAIRDSGKRTFVNSILNISRGTELFHQSRRVAEKDGAENPETTYRAISEAWLLSGELDTTDIGVSNDDILTKIAGDGLDRSSIFGLRDTTGGKSLLGISGIEPEDLMDLDGFNFMAARFRDLEDADSWIEADQFGARKFTARFPEAMRPKLEKYLEAGGIEPSPYNILQFLDYQSVKWGPSNKTPK